jgi:hypothetical protein
VLLTAEGRLGLITETVTEGIYDWNVAANARWVSDRLKIILGISEARKLSSTLRWDDVPCGTMDEVSSPNRLDLPFVTAKAAW